jgi:hypothetical protein
MGRFAVFSTKAVAPMNGVISVFIDLVLEKAGAARQD